MFTSTHIYYRFIGRQKRLGFKTSQISNKVLFVNTPSGCHVVDLVFCVYTQVCLHVEVWRMRSFSFISMVFVMPQQKSSTRCMYRMSVQGSPGTWWYFSSMLECSCQDWKKSPCISLAFNYTAHHSVSPIKSPFLARLYTATLHRAFTPVQTVLVTRTRYRLYRNNRVCVICNCFTMITLTILFGLVLPS